jgi:demethylmenaquinone methyltransferase/2-methoxy-6-polyprenyl-1,4-benzoquinol methylase
MPSRHDYSRQAETYDETRSASPSVLAVLRQALDGAPRPRLLDVGGGTGNYALALAGDGWEPLVADLSAPMLERAAAKGLDTVQADATALPFEDSSFDAVTMISMIHHVTDQAAAVREAQRVLRPGGRLVLKGWMREHIEEVGWMLEYFPSTRSWMIDQHPPYAFFEDLLPGARALPVFFEDHEDGSIGALQRRPELILDPELRRQTSFFERLARDHPAELESGLERLEDDIASGHSRDESARERYGDLTVLAWAKPAVS